MTFKEATLRELRDAIDYNIDKFGRTNPMNSKTYEDFIKVYRKNLTGDYSLK